MLCSGEMRACFTTPLLVALALGLSACGESASSQPPDAASPCGNGDIDEGETCDDGNSETEACGYDEASCEVCGSTCTNVPGPLRFCGDGLVEVAEEECDAGDATTEECPLGEIGCMLCDASCTLVPGVPNSGNTAPTATIKEPTSAEFLPGETKVLEVDAVDSDGDVLTVTWAIFSATADGVECGGEVSPQTTADDALSVTLPQAHSDVRCADELRVEVTVTDGVLSATDEIVLTVGAPDNLGSVWRQREDNPILALSTCPTWECLGHGDPTLARDDSGTLNLWFSSAGDRGGPVIGRAVETAGGDFLLAPNAPVMEPDPNNVPPAPLPWDYKRETVSVTKAPTVDRWNMLYLGYQTDYFTDAAIGLTQSSDDAGTVWPRPPAPIYTPTRPDGWDAGFLTSPQGLLGSDGVLRVYYAGANFGIDGVGKIGVITSTDDGATWTPYSGNPVFSGIANRWDESIIDAQVTFVGGRYLMWYSAFENPLDVNPMAIGLATSEDGYSWSRVGSEPVIKPAAPGTWNDFRVLDPEIIVEPDGSLLMAAYATSLAGPTAAYSFGLPQRLGLWTSQACSPDGAVPCSCDPGQYGVDCSGTCACPADRCDDGIVGTGLCAAPAPPVGVAVEGIEFGEGWRNPRLLPAPIQSDGWEDSPFISSDGSTLYFGFSSWDATQLIFNSAVVDGGTTRPGQVSDRFDIYSASFETGSWVVDHHPTNSADTGFSEAAIGVTPSQDSMVFTRFEPDANIFLATGGPNAWGTPTILPSPINTPCAEDNPHLAGAGTKIFFDSNRANATGTICIDESAGDRRSIWVTEFVDNAWGTPELVTGAPNADGDNNWQAWTTDDATEIYWSGVQSDCTGTGCIYRALLQPDGSYSDKRLVAQSTSLADTDLDGKVVFMGEVSLTQDQRYLYFACGITRDVDDTNLFGLIDRIDMELCVAHRGM